MPAGTTITIRAYEADDHRAIGDLYHDTIHVVGRLHYTAAQCEAWAPTPVDYAAWAVRLDRKRPWVAVIDGDVVGFIELDPDGHIDCMYTHKDFQRRGVASLLYRHLLESARQQGMKRLYVEASHFARPFFERQGYRLVKQQEVARNGQWLTNFLMETLLADEPA